MADTPDNNIEKQLRDYAQQRRDDAGAPTMHPATRQMLQAEVKEQFGGAASSTKSPRTGWMKFWPRLAFALGIIVIVGVAAVLLLPPDKKASESFTLAKMEEPKIIAASGEQKKAAPPPAPLAPMAAAMPAASSLDTAAPALFDANNATLTTAAGSSIRRFDTPARSETNLKSKAALRDIAKSPAPAAAAPVAQPAMKSAAKEQSRFYADGLVAGDKDIAAATRESAPKSGTYSLGVVGYVGNEKGTGALLATNGIALNNKSEAFGGAATLARNNDFAYANNLGNAQRFRNIIADDRKQQKILPVLDEFTVAQNGEVLTIVDRDGSIYNGYARLVTAERQLNQMNQFTRNAGADSSGAMQLVPNSLSGGRGGAVFNQNTMNRATDNTIGQSQAAIGQGNALPSGYNLVGVQSFNYSFRVEGTNRSLNQRVVLTGNLLQNTGNLNFNNFNNAQNAGINQNFRQQNAPAGAVGQNFYNVNRAQQSPTPNNYINGRVQLGDKSAADFNALSIEP